MIGFLLARSVEEFRKVNSQLLHETIQKLLPCLLSARINNLQVAVLPLALNHQTIRESQPQERRYCRPRAFSLRRTVFVTAKSPSNSIQYASLSLAVIASYNRQSCAAGLDLNGLDPFDVLNFQFIDSNHCNHPHLQCFKVKRWHEGHPIQFLSDNDDALSFDQIR
ncbi:hypothetical protein D3C80_1622380 [compost metagenome]